MITTLEAYRHATAELRRSVQTMGESLEHDAGLMNEFLCYRSAKHQFFPEHTADDVAFFLEAQYNIQLSAQLENKVSGPLLLSQVTAEGDTDFVAQRGRQPFIFCTFHFGSYQMVGTLLRQLGFDFVVLTLREGITPDMLHQAAATDRLDVLHADSPSVMLEMQNALRAGKSIMAFIDGNPNSIQEADRKAYARVNLLGHTLLAKKGIPSLAYAAGVPIIPIVSYRTGAEQVRVAFGSPLRPDRSQPRAQYVQHALQACYGQLEHYLRTRPEQWLYWRMVHNYFELSDAAGGRAATAEELAAPTHYTLNAARYELYQARHHAYLYDRSTQQAFTVSANLLGYLRHLAAAPEPVAIVTARLNPTLRQDLLGRQVLRGLQLERP